MHDRMLWPPYPPYLGNVFLISYLFIFFKIFTAGIEQENYYSGYKNLTSKRHGVSDQFELSQCIDLLISFINGSTAFGPWPLLQFPNLFLYTDGRTPWTWAQPVARLLPTHSTT
jgi:hypothetical protein